MKTDKEKTYQIHHILVYCIVDNEQTRADTESKTSDHREHRDSGNTFVIVVGI